jgi:phage terminase large subunit-like protein
VRAGEVSDDTFFYRWYAADQECDPHDPEAWRKANPAFGDFLDPEDFSSAVKSLPEAEFKTKRLNLWVSSATTWMPHGAWDACASERRLQDGEEIVVGFDGSFSNDSTALIASTLDGFVEVLGMWERPIDDEHWRVDIVEVEETIRQVCKRYKVREVACDPYRWQRILSILQAEGLPMVEFGQSPSRMIPATSLFFDAVTQGRITHSGDPRLSRHVANATIKIDAQGPRLQKEHRSSPRKIDAAVAAVVCYARAVHLANTPPEEKPQVRFWSPVDV